MGFLSKFKKKEGFDDDEFPDLNDLRQQPALGPAAFSNPTREQGGFPAPQMNPDPTFGVNPSSLSMQSAQNSINNVMSRIDLLISRIESLKMVIDSMSQRLYKVEQLLSYQKTGVQATQQSEYKYAPSQSQPQQSSFGSSYQSQSQSTPSYGSSGSNSGTSSGFQFGSSGQQSQQSSEKKDEDYAWPF